MGRCPQEQLFRFQHVQHIQLGESHQRTATPFVTRPSGDNLKTVHTLPWKAPTGSFDKKIVVYSAITTSIITNTTTIILCYCCIMLYYTVEGATSIRTKILLHSRAGYSLHLSTNNTATTTNALWVRTNSTGLDPQAV